MSMFGLCAVSLIILAPSLKFSIGPENSARSPAADAIIDLIEQLSDGAVSTPALGFAMGDVVLGELIRDRAAAREKMEAAVQSERKIDIYVVIAKEARRADALAHVQELRENGYRVDYPLTPTKVAKQFQTAEDLGATIALLYGDEWPQVKVKKLATREESLIAHEALLDGVAKFFNPSASA